MFSQKWFLPVKSGKKDEFAKSKKGIKSLDMGVSNWYSQFEFINYKNSFLKGVFLMKGNEKLIEVLNDLLADELTAINQYIVHGEMCADWGYGKLHEHFEQRSIQEMKHAETLIERILFLGGLPVVSKLKDIHIGGEIPEQLENDRKAELGAIEAYNQAIKLAGEVNDFATRDILTSILNDEDRHMDEIEALQDQISHMTLPIFLTTKVE